ncbi:MAG TPA: hypothetical protein VGV40_12850 [Solirubrobacteraceae bacterium]|nr:hypothetical protein [Solirubrobacteraceae bacterium]
MFLLSWLLYLLVLAGLCLGCGLLLRRLAGDALPSALLLPAGLAVVVVVAVLLTFLAVTAPLTAPALVFLALAGFALTGRRGLAALRPGRSWRWPALAAALPFAALAAPVLLTGQPGFTGYARIVDLAFQMDIAAHLVADGRSVPAAPDSSFTRIIDRTLGGGYPGGVQAAVGSTAGVAGVDIIWAWQPFIAWLGAMLGLSLHALLARAIARAPGRAVAAGVAAQPTILYSYALASGIKELGAALFFVLVAALLLTAWPARAVGSVRGGLPVLVAATAGLGTFTLGFLPWLVVLLLVGIGGPALVHRRRGRPTEAVGAGRTWLVLAAIAVLVSVPVIVGAVEVAPLLAVGGPADLGNLAAPVPAWAALGPWLTQDYRYPLDVAGTELPTALLAVLVGLLAAAGLARAVLRRNLALVAAGTAAAVALVVVLWGGNTWVELKAIVVSAPIAVALAFAGAAGLGRGRLHRGAPTVAGALVVVAVLGGNALVYRGTTLAPYDRLAELAEIAERLDSAGRTLHPAFEEYAGYLLREEGAVTPVEAPFDVKNLRPGAPKGQLFSRDLDDLRLDYLAGFDLLVLRRDPTHSRPPSGFRLVQRTDHYAVWRRDPGAAQELFHLPLTTQGEGSTPTRAQCEQVRGALQAAGPGASLAYAPAPQVAVSPIPEEITPARWKVTGQDRLARGPGRGEVGFFVPHDGTYRVWLRGSVGREVRVLVAGRPVGDVRWRLSYPDQYEPVGTVRLVRGTHSAQVVRAGGSLLPGTADDLGLEGTTTRIGPLAIQPVDGPRPVSYAPPSRAMDVCRGGQPLDWLEVVR